MQNIWPKVQVGPTMQWKRTLSPILCFYFANALFAQTASSNQAASNWQTKAFDLKYADPERLRSLFSDRSVVIEASRDLNVLTVHGSPAFIKEVEDAVKRYDVAPQPPPNLQITVYLLTTASRSPSGVAIPADLASFSKDFGTQGAKLADSQILRVREGQPGQVVGFPNKPDTAALTRVWMQSATVNPGAKADKISVYGLRIWMNMPAAPAASGVSVNLAAGSQLRADPDVSADVDLDNNQPVMVSKVGIDQPVMVLIRATVIRLNQAKPRKLFLRIAN